MIATAMIYILSAEAHPGISTLRIVLYVTAGLLAIAAVLVEALGPIVFNGTRNDNALIHGITLCLVIIIALLIGWSIHL